MADARTPRPVEPRPAATVLLVRDGDDGLETLLLQRNPAVPFVGGAHVFPGGAVDDADRALAASTLDGPGPDDAAASRELGVARHGLAFWLAAIRECFEECGVLLATDADGVPASGVGDLGARLAEHRRAVEAGRRPIGEVCAREGLRPATGDLRYLGHWITPEGSPRRYDTRFFVAPAPPEQQAEPDGREAVSATWLTPVAALDRWRAGDLELILPTQRSLEAAAGFPTAGDFLTALAAAPLDADGARRTIDDQGGRRVVLDDLRPGALVP